MNLQILLTNFKTWIPISFPPKKESELQYKSKCNFTKRGKKCMFIHMRTYKEVREIFSIKLIQNKDHKLNINL